MNLYPARSLKFLGKFCLQVTLSGLFALTFALNAHAEMPKGLVYPGAKIEVFEEQLTDDAHVVLSAPKRVSNSLRLENEKWISGYRQSWLLRLDRSADNAAVKRFYEQQIGQHGEVLFACEGRGCGTSSDWANKLLDQSVLSGRDSNQHYVAGRYLHQGVPGWLSVYIVQNGRRQNYAYIQYVSETREGGFGPKDVIYLQLDDLDQGQKDRIERLFVDGNYVLIGVQMRHSDRLDLDVWEGRSAMMEAWLNDYLNSLVPDWKKQSRVLRSPPVQAVPGHLEGDAWFVFVSIQN